jgi:hypothetical protein
MMSARLRQYFANRNRHAVRLYFGIAIELAKSERRPEVRWYLHTIAAVLLAAGFNLAGPANAQTCGDHGTNVHFEKNPKDAATKAAKEEKLVLVIHISGYFEDPEYT